MKSMTGYGRGEIKGSILDLSVELSSVNRKGGIEVASHIPGEWHRLEPKLVERIKKHFQRGKFSLGVRFNFHDSSCGVYWNPEAVGQAVKQLRGLAEAQGVELELNGEVLLNLVKMIDTSSALPDALEVEDMVITALASRGCLMSMPVVWTWS